MPKKYWHNMPETDADPRPARRGGCAHAGDGGAGADRAASARKAPRCRKHEIAETASAVAAVREQAKHCERCPLYRNATQTVFGEGPADAPLVFVGEQPGDQEDLAGKPFVGPAGQMFDRALAEAGIDRTRVYVTNAVKHFKFEPRGKRRIHQKPNNNEIDACRWWLDQELGLIKPRFTVALGATAARALTGRDTTISRSRGTADDAARGRRGLHHGASLVPAAPAGRGREGAEYARFVEDLRAGCAASAGDQEGGLTSSAPRRRPSCRRASPHTGRRYRGR